MPETNFNNYSLGSDILKAIELLNYKNPTSVQQRVIPYVFESRDIIVKSRTGSGKTAAFAIPVCEQVRWEGNKPQALVIAPTRELAIQVREEIFSIGRFKRLKVSVLYGGSSSYIQEKELKQKTHVVVGTPGRIIDHIERGNFDTSEIKYLVIDEADEMLDMGFIEQIEEIINKLPKDRSTLIFSATMPADITALCDKYMKEPIIVQIDEENPVAEMIYQEKCFVGSDDKIKILMDIIIVENPDSCIIFCNTKQKVEEVYGELARSDYSCEKLHGGMEQSDRLKVMDSFRQGCFRYLIATDVAARGIDIDNISLVINFDIPQDKESYVHRIGRTGRMDRKGKAITFYSLGEEKYLNAIHEYIGYGLVSREKPDAETVDNSRLKFNEKTSKRPEFKGTKCSVLNSEIIKIHINAGRKNKMRAADIVGTLCSIEGITSEDIGIINIYDVSSFVEILNNKGEEVLKELRNKTIKGRQRKVKKVLQ